MPSSSVPRLVAAAALLGLCAAGAGSAPAAGPVAVTVNGSPVTLDPPPTERAGRVFVPLRGVFENLGATVVYASGVINATGRGHSISLRIGSQQATVDGQQQTLDVAPFIIGASTYVPLRFVSQALGATVNYDGTNDVVAINTRGGGNPPNQTIRPPNQTLTPAPGYGPGSAITLASLQPARGATVRSSRPTIEAIFGAGTADPNSIRVSLDGANVTENATRSPHGFTYAPQSPLLAGEHRVLVTGNDANGQPFKGSWVFSSGSAAEVGQITNVRPSIGATVPDRFTVSGRTTPGARVTVQVGVANGGSESIGAILGSLLGGGQTNSANYSLTADANGYFTTQVNIAAQSGSALTLVINATDAQTGATQTPVRERLTLG